MSSVPENRAVLPSEHIQGRFVRPRVRPSLCVLLGFTGAIGVSGCDSFVDDEARTGDPEAEVQEHVEQFRQEVRTRGLDVDAKIDSLHVTVHDELTFDGMAYCGFVSLTPSGEYSNRVLFSSEDACWNDQSVHDREVTVFHELGHAVLNRGHKDEKLPGGSWASIMKSRSGFGYTLYSDRTIERRDYYLDELVDENTPAPSWAQ